jgi:hypothetical protein
MESAPLTINFKAKVVKVEERFNKEWIMGAGENAIFKKVSMGWYVQLAGSWESLFVGATAPDIDIGDIAMIRISFHDPE